MLDAVACRGKVLLISANRCTVPEEVFPLGLAHLNGALKQAGYLVDWHDALASSERLEETVARFRPDFIGISLRNVDDISICRKETFHGTLCSVTETIRRFVECPIILGGSAFSIFPREFLETSRADFGVVGAGEEPLLALLAALKQGAAYTSIPGLVFRQNESIQVNPFGPSPWSGQGAKAVRPPQIRDYYLRQSGVMNVQTQRGCAWNCCYCTYPVIEVRTPRARMAEEVAAEFEQLQKMGARYVFIVDSVFNSSPEHVASVCEALIRKPLRVEWGCFLRPAGLTADLMGLMRRAGLRHVEFGSDSLCDAVLAAYHKHLTFEQILQSHELARREGISACHFLIAGGPGETAATLARSFGNSRHLREAIFVVIVGMRIYPGTPLLQLAYRDGIVGLKEGLLTPTYYLAPGLELDTLLVRLREFAGERPNWIIGDPSPVYQGLTQRLRKRGAVGPLWEYLVTLQRLSPAKASAPPPGPD